MSHLHSCRRMALAAACSFLFLVTLHLPTAFADDAVWNGSIPGTGEGNAVLFPHEDAEPFKGSVFVNVTNSGTEPWGDFHFAIYDPMGGQDISNVHFLDASLGGLDPTSTQMPFSWAIDNEIVGSMIDLYFYSDPILPGEAASFQVYTDNADHLSFFGVMFYPTPLMTPAEPDSWSRIKSIYR